MKRRFLATLLTVAMMATMFASVTAVADSAAVVRTYLDMNMDNWTSGTDRLNADNKAISTTLGVADNAGQFDVDKNYILNQTVVEDDVVASKVWQFERSVEGTDGSRIRFYIDDDSFASNVLWTEISVKYENAFSRISFEHNNAISTMFIDNNGIIRTGLSNSWQNDNDWKTAKALTTEPLELGKWYHLVLAIDNSNSSRPMYLWVNGEKVVNGTVSSSSGAGLNYLDFRVTYPSVQNVISIDNFRLYTTAALDTHAEDVSLTDANADDEIFVEAGYILGGTGKTVSEIKDAFTGGDALTFVKDGEILADEADATDAAIYAPIANGKGFRTLEAVPAGTQVITKNVMDVNFDNWGSGTHSLLSNGGSLATAWDGATSANQVVTTLEKEGKSLKITPITTNTNYFMRGRMSTGGVSSTYASCDILWTEFSVKFEGGFIGIGFGENDNAYDIINVNSKGQLVKNARWGFGELGGGNYAAGSAIPGVQLEVGKWYHIVSALDFTDADAATSGAPIYVWLNGELVDSGSRATNLTPSCPWKFHKLWVDQAASEGRSVYIDNLKVYETSRIDTHAETDFAISVTDAVADDEIEIVANMISAPADAKVSDIRNAITADNYLFTKDGAQLADDADAIGALMTVVAENNIGIKQYNIVETIPQLITTSYADINFDNWSAADSNLNSDGSSATLSWAGAAATESGPAKVAEKEDNAYKLVMGKGESGPTGHYRRFRQTNGVPSKFGSDSVLWTEYSVKYEGQFVGVGTEHDNAVAPVSINKDGKVNLFTKQGFNECGYGTITPAATLDYQLELGGWYHIIYAIDLTNGGALYLWINGEQLVDGEYSQSTVAADAKWVYNKFWVDCVAADREGTATVYVDNYKVYETESVNKDYAPALFDVTVADANAEDDITIDGKTIKIPEDANVAQVKAAISAQKYLFLKDGALLADTDAAIDAILIAYEDGLAGFKQYKLVDNRVAVNLAEGINSISSSIPTRGKAHPVEGMIDGNREFHSSNGGTDSSLYKSDKGTYNNVADQNELKVLLTLDGVYDVRAVNVYTRVVVQTATTADVTLINNGVFTEVASDVALSTTINTTKSAENIITFEAGKADAVLITFHTADTSVYEENTNMGTIESNYQIVEIELYGFGKESEIATTDVLEGYAFATVGNDAFVIAIANAADTAIVGEMIVAAYEEDELVAVSSPRAIEFGKGITATTSLSTSGLIADGREYKVFVWDSLEGGKPLFKAKALVK